MPSENWATRSMLVASFEPRLTTWISYVTSLPTGSGPFGSLTISFRSARASTVVTAVSEAALSSVPCRRAANWF